LLASASYAVSGISAMANKGYLLQHWSRDLACLQEAFITEFRDNLEKK
jgi:hypothetical protein